MPSEKPEIPDTFARAFGDALATFINQQGLEKTVAARRVGITKSRLNTYLHDSPTGVRRSPNADVLYRFCTNLGFSFEFNGFRISAASLNGNGVKPASAEQRTLDFEGQFNLTDEKGTVHVNVKRPLGRIEVTLSLKAAS